MTCRLVSFWLRAGSRCSRTHQCNVKAALVRWTRLGSDLHVAELTIWDTVKPRSGRVEFYMKMRKSQVIVSLVMVVPLTKRYAYEHTYSCRVDSIDRRTRTMFHRRQSPFCERLQMSDLQHAEVLSARSWSCIPLSLMSLMLGGGRVGLQIALLSERT